MNDELDARARRAADAVRQRSADLPGNGLADVVARGERRPRAPGVLALVVLVVVGAAVLRVAPGGPGIGFGDASPEPSLTATAEPTSVPTPVPTPTPTPATPAPVPTTPPPPAPATPPPPATVPVPDPTPTADPTPLPPLGTPSLSPVTAGDFPDGGGEVAHLVDVRVARQVGFDRVVLELTGPDAPSYSVSFVDPPITAAGSGEEIAVEGDAYLQVLLSPASRVVFDDSPEGYSLTYDGPDRVRGATANVTEVVRTGDFEAHLGWVVGLGTAAPFSVTLLTDPMRLVIDVLHE